jgi:hypothetical protein
LETSDKLLTFDTIPDLINIIKRYIWGTNNQYKTN